MITAPPLMRLIAAEFGGFAREVEPRQAERVAAIAEQLGCVRRVGLGVALEDLGRGDRHRRIEKHLHRRRQPVLLAALAQQVEQLLRALERKRRDDDVAAALERFADRLVKLFDRRRDRLVQAIAVGRLHHHDVNFGRIGGRPQQRPAGVAEVAGKEQPPAFRPFLEFEQDAGRAENMAGVEEGDGHARRQRDRLVVGGDAAEGVAGVERVKGRIEWRAVGRIASARAVLRPATGILFLQMGRVEHHQPGQFARRAGRDDLAAEAAFVKQGHASAMVEMGVGEQQRVD